MKNKLHPNIIWLGIASLFNDISGEIITRVLPLFLSATLGIGMGLIGLIEGVADTTSSLLKIISGWYSDRFKTRKAPTVLGYAITAAARPLLLFTSSWLLPLISRFLDRAGKGIRTAPRDALVADSVDAQSRGRAFGIQRTLDPLGAVIGALVASLVTGLLTNDSPMTISAHTFTTLIYIAAIPSFVSVLLIAIFVRNIKVHASPHERKEIRTHESSFSVPFKRYLIVLFIFSLGMSSDAFLLLRSAQAGLRPSEIFLLVAFFNLVTTITAYPAGILADKLGKRKVIIIGWMFYGAIYIGFAIADSPSMISLLFILYGLYYGITEGVEKALVADLVPAQKRGAAYGLFNAVIGFSALPASVGFGFLWQQFGAPVAFSVGAGCALLAGVLLSFAIKGELNETIEYKL
ncbi:MAG TPA: MFS transporter [Candidatus Kapabacteria bacterium]|nr:MFS transporter [Candidatus Kapabacteria bacterium]